MDLTDSELVILDGRCSPETQSLVEAAKERLAMVDSLPGEPAIAGFVADAVRAAREDGRLRYETTSLSHCKICGRDAGYAKYKRSGRYHEKGATRYDRPLYIGGVELRGGFIRVQGCARLGCCHECFAKAKPHLKTALAAVRAEISVYITGEQPKFRRYDNCECTACGWSGHDGELGLLPAILRGSYPGQCPKCGAKNMAFGPNIIKATEGFVVVEAVKQAEAVNG